MSEMATTPRRRVDRNLYCTYYVCHEDSQQRKICSHFWVPVPAALILRSVYQLIGVFKKSMNKVLILYTEHARYYDSGRSEDYLTICLGQIRRTDLLKADLGLIHTVFLETLSVPTASIRNVSHLWV